MSEDKGLLLPHSDDVWAVVNNPVGAAAELDALRQRVAQADERGDEAMRRAHEAESRLAAAEREADGLRMALQASDDYQTRLEDEGYTYRKLLREVLGAGLTGWCSQPASDLYDSIDAALKEARHE